MFCSFFSSVWVPQLFFPINPSWKQIRSMDVMDGFGRNGDVANGSFEHVAPFGASPPDDGEWRGAREQADKVKRREETWFRLANQRRFLDHLA